MNNQLIHSELVAEITKLYQIVGTTPNCKADIIEIEAAMASIPDLDAQMRRNLKKIKSSVFALTSA